MDFHQLPRDGDGIVPGYYRLRHRDRDFSHALGGVTFERGETTAPVPGQEAARLLAALGSDVEALPCDETSDTGVAPGSDADASTPTTWADLEALDEDRLRALAADLGATDRRWKAPRLRSFIADELGIEGGA